VLEVLELAAHHLGPAHTPVQGSFIENEEDFRRILALEHLFLAPHAKLDPFLDPLIRCSPGEGLQASGLKGRPRSG
jgi:hypothetical protein